VLYEYAVILLGAPYKFIPIYY